MSLELNLKNYLKQQLRERGISYRELSRGLEVSESTVKRLFSSKSLSMDEFEKCCQFLGLPISDVLLAASGESAKLAQLSWDQEDFLCQNPVSDYLFLRLMFGFSIEDVQKELHLTPSDLKRALAGLEKHSLLSISKKNKPLIKKRGPFHWIEGGPFERTFKKIFFKTIADHLERSRSDNASLAMASAFELYLCRANFENLKREFTELSTRYKKISRLDQLTFSAMDLVPVSVLLGADEFNAWKSVIFKGTRLPKGP